MALDCGSFKLGLSVTIAVLQAGRQSDLPKGSVKLGASQSGATQVRAEAMQDFAQFTKARERRVVLGPTAGLCSLPRAMLLHPVPSRSPHPLLPSPSPQYYEPAPAIPLNNNEVSLAAKEKEEEVAVLLLLSSLVGAAFAIIYDGRYAC